MEIRKIFGLNGPNIWANSPVVEAWVDLGQFEELPTDKLPGFTERLMQALPSLIEHRCSIGERGGFLQRLQTGTWLGHVLEHVTLELQTLTHAPVGWGRARETQERGVYKVVVKCEDTRFAEACMRGARELILALVEGRAFDVESELTRLRAAADQLCLGPSTRAIVQAAKARGIPFIRLTEGNLMQLGHGKAQRRIWTAETDRTSAVAEGIAQDKDLTRRLLAAAGVPVPTGRRVQDPDDAWRAARDMGEPVVVKPIDANHGRGVSIRLEEEAAIRAAFELAAAEGSGVVVERFVPGTQHRVLIVGDRAIAAASGEADELVGDGSSTIRQLVEQANRDPRRGEGSAQLLTLLELNPIALDLLRTQGFTADSVPSAGERVLIQYHGDLTVDESDRLHPEVAATCVLAAQTVGLDIAGIDLVAGDISQPLASQGGAVIEVNASPGLVAHLKPLVGKPRPVGEAIVAQLFAPGEEGRVPLVAVSGTQERAATATWIARCLAAHIGAAVGRADATGTYLGSRLLSSAPAATAEGARRLLMNPNAAAAVLEVAEHDTLEHGLAFDRCQVAVVTTTEGAGALARPGVDDETTIEKAIRAPVDVVSPGGFAVVHAGDPALARLTEHCKGKLVLVGASRDASPLREHLAAGGSALVRLGNQLWWCHDGRTDPPIDVAQSESITKSCVEPVVAAAAVALALGMSRSAVQEFFNNSKE